MSFAPLLQSSLAIQIHTVAAILAVLLGAVVLWGEKGTRLHKALGRTWVVCMLVTATSAWFISEIRLIGPFSPIHLFSVLTYAGLFEAIRAARRNDIAAHRAGMQGVYLGALLLAGAFTLLPGRRMHAVLFGPDAGWPVSIGAIALVLGLSAFLWLRWRRRPMVPR